MPEPATAVTIVTVQDKGALKNFLRVPYAAICRNHPQLRLSRCSASSGISSTARRTPSSTTPRPSCGSPATRGPDRRPHRRRVDRYNNEHHDEQVGFFGFYEAVDDPALAAALLGTARDWIAGRGMTIMRGPGCFTSNHDWYGLQVDGPFDRPVIGMPYNHPTTRSSSRRSA